MGNEQKQLAWRIGWPVWCAACVLLFLVSIGRAAAQASNAQVRGLVADTSGAAIPGATVKAVDEDTSVPYSTTSNASGNFTLEQLVPGKYRITAVKSGFGDILHSGIILNAGDRLVQNFSMTLGSVEQTVTVTSTTPLILSDQATVSTVLDNKLITELPQLNRNPLDLTATVPSVQGSGPLTDNIEALGNAAYLIANHGNSYSLSGGQVNGTSIIVDGNQVQESEFNSNNRAIPTPDSIGEFRVDSGALTADYGRYSGGIISMQTRSGTNEYHGRAFEYLRNQTMDSNGWQNNSLGIPRQPFTQNNYGASVGGPVSIPHLYSGKKRTFFFFGWEGERFSLSQTVQSSIPTALNHVGDFSQTVINYQNGAPVYASIYDPFHGYTDGSGNWIRPHFPGNVIPATATADLSGQSQLFLKYLALWPMPNHAPAANSDHQNNYYSTIDTVRPTDRYFGRIDENLNNNNRINFTIGRSMMTDTIPAPFLHGGQSVTTDGDWLGSLLYNWVISPSSILDVHVGFGTTDLVSTGVSGYGSAPDPSIDVSSWGFDPLIVGNPERTTNNIPPALNIPGYTPVGGSEFDSFITQTVNGSVAYTKLLGRHTIKVGYEQYLYRFTEQGGDHTGTAWVNPGGGSNQTWNQNDGLTGSPLAELMMGSSNFFQWGNWDITPYGVNEAAYGMDDWRVNNKLNINIGLRWDHDGARQGRKPQGSLMYDINAKNVLSANSGWNWSQVTGQEAGLSSLPTPQWITQGTSGRIVLLDTKEYPQKNLYQTSLNNFQPRVGFSYQINGATFLHGNAGIVDEGLNGLSTDYYSFYYNSNTFNQIPTLDGQHWISEFGNDHGLRTFPLQPNGSNLGFYPPVTTNADYGYQTFGSSANPDQGGSALLPFYKSPTDYMWGVNVQRQLGKNWALTAEYAGIRGIHLLMPTSGWSTNNIPLSYYSLGSELYDQVPNPFYGQSQTFASEPTVALYQLFGGSPQYTSLNPGQAAWGKSFSNYFDLQVQTQATHGLTLLASWTVRKTLTNTGGKDPQHSGTTNIGILQNPHNLMEGYGLALYEKPQTFKLSGSYDIPIGRGRLLLASPNGVGSHVLDALLGGWGIAGISVWDPKGTPVLVPTVDGGLTAPGAAIRWSLLSGGYAASHKNYAGDVYVNGAFTNGTGASVFNAAAFGRTPDYTIGASPFVFRNVRNPGDFSTDATLLKNFYISANKVRYFEVRAEAENVFNHATYGNINNDPDSPTFGGINGKTGNRVMQIGGRFFF
jgi:hypothetical protein